MKKMSVILASLCVLSAAAMAADVYSVNGVGYESFSIAGGKSALIRIDFEKVGGGTWKVADLFGTNSVLGMRVYYWNTNTVGWSSVTWDPEDKLWIPSTTPFVRGQSLFVTMFGSSDVTNTFAIAGEVPGSNNGGSNTVLSLVQGFNGVSYAYPNSIAITNTTLSVAAGGSGLSVYYWMNEGWRNVVWDSEDNIWIPSSFVLQPGQGVLVRRYATGSTSWAEEKKYNWP